MKIDKVEEGLPISVIVPLSKHRRSFFEAMVLPMIEHNNPIEIIINDFKGSAPEKRNNAFHLATQPYVIFWDDDCVMPNDFLLKLYSALKDSNYAFAYTGYHGIVFDSSASMKDNYHIPTIEYNVELLRKENYISTMSLIRKTEFLFFDESLNRFQDWDLWLTLQENLKSGKAVFNNEFYAFTNDKGISSQSNSLVDAYNIIKKKHKL